MTTPLTTPDATTALAAARIDPTGALLGEMGIATIAMTIVKNEANDSAGLGSYGTWTVEDGARRFLEVMASRGYTLVSDAELERLRGALRRVDGWRVDPEHYEMPEEMLDMLAGAVRAILASAEGGER